MRSWTSRDRLGLDERLTRRLLERPLTAWRAARIISAATLVIVLVSGVGMHWVEPSTYPSAGRGLWWAVQTVTSVGYGDVVPHSVGGRLLAVLVMVAGIALLTVVVATISAGFVEASRRRAEQRKLLDDPVRRALEQIEQRLAAIEDALRGSPRL